MSARRPSPRDDSTSPWRAVAGIVVMMTLAIACAWWFTREIEGRVRRATPYPSHDSLGPTYLYDGQSVIRWYVFTDPETGLQYLVNDRGGCVQRVGSDGRQMGGANG